MEKVIWFSRHQPTEAQVAELAAAGREIAGIEAGMELGADALNSTEDVERVLAELFALAAEHGARRIYGVFATPLLQKMQEFTAASLHHGWYLPDSLSCYAAWNVSRSVEGGKPSFTHKAFLHVGDIAPEAK